MQRRVRKLDLIPLEEARSRFIEAAVQRPESTPVEELIEARLSLNRITSRPLLARRSSPPFRSAAMDGIAVRAADLANARADRPLRLRQGQGFQYVDTGQPLATRFDAVVMIEHVERLDEESVVVVAAVEAGQHVRQPGEDFRAGEMVLEAHRRVTPEAVAALLATGNIRVPVQRKPRCTYIPVGSELVPPEIEPVRGQVPESNSQIFAGWIRMWGGEPRVLSVVPNDVDLMAEALEAAVADSDLVVVGSGTSKGREDLTAELVRRTGEVLVHGVAYHPGHPILLGRVRQKPVVGLPGYAVAGWLGLMQFVRPLLERWLGVSLSPNRVVTARLAAQVRGRPGARHFVRVRLERAAGHYVAHPLPGGAGRLSTLLQADGLLEVAEDCERLEVGNEVRITLLETAHAPVQDG